MSASPSIRSLPASLELRAGSGSGIAALTEGTASLGDLAVHVAITDDGPGLRIDWTLHNPGTAPVAVDEVRIRFSELRPERVVERGWSASSAVRTATPGEVSLPVSAARDCADITRAGRSVVAHQVLVHDTGVLGLLDGRSQLGFIETPSPRASGPGTAVVLLLDGTEIDPGTSLTLAPVWLATGDPDQLVAEFHQRWGQESDACAAVRTPLGWWADPHLSDRAMTSGMVLAGDHGLHHAVIDITAAHIRELPAQLRAAGLRPALRLRPFALGPRGPLAARAVEQGPGRPVVLDACLVADLTDPVVLDHLRQRIADLAAAGWEQFVLEGVWQGAVAGRRSAGRTVTRAQALRMGLDAVRDGAGADAVITVVDAPAGPTVGVAHRCVTGALTLAGQAAVLHRAAEHRRLWAA